MMKQPSKSNHDTAQPNSDSFSRRQRLEKSPAEMAPATLATEDIAALEVLKGTGVNTLEAALIAKEALEKGRGRLKRARACIAAGEEALREREKTVCFARAVEVAIAAKSGCRTRTQSDFRYLTRRLMSRCPKLAQRRVRSITMAECITYLQQAFDTPSQRNKGRLALSSVFSTACRRGWCTENPVRGIRAEKIEEKRISILNKEQTARLLQAASNHVSGICLAAVGIMLYAGIRPYEVERLRWQDVRMDAGVICISPQHSKTGGARFVTIHPPLKKLLRHLRGADDERICPPNWRRRWAELHRAAGFTPWQPDVLRHTFATHHLATFRNYAELQVEMGHRSATLLRNRYIAMEGLMHSDYRRGTSMLVG